MAKLKSFKPICKYFLETCHAWLEKFSCLNKKPAKNYMSYIQAERDHSEIWEDLIQGMLSLF